MKRPFAVIGFTAFAVAFVMFFTARTDVAFTGAVTSSVCVLLYLKFIRRGFTVPLIFLAAVLSCLLFLSSDTQRGKTQSLAGKGVGVEATVCEMPWKGADKNRHYAVCKLISVNGVKVKGRVRISFSPSKDGIDPDVLKTGNRVSFTGTVYIPGAGQRDIEQYFTGEKIYLGAYGVKNLVVAEPSLRGISYYFQLLRNNIADKISAAFSDSVAGVLVGVLTGDKSYMSDEINENFKKSGIAHLMAVSGLHLSVWVFFIGAMLPDEGNFAKFKYIFLLVITVFVMLLAGMSESVKRAGLMSFVHIIGCLVQKKSDGLNSLGFAVFMMILFNPNCVLSLSFQLSVISTLAILTLGKACTEKTRGFFEYEGYRKSVPVKILKLCFDSFSISMCVLVFTLPLQIYEFGGISSVSALTNLLVAPVTTPLLVLAGGYAILSPLSFVSYPIAFMADAVAEYVVFVSGWLAKPESAFISFEISNAFEYFLAFLVVFAFYFLLFRKNIVIFFKRSFATKVYMCYNYIKYGSGGESNAGI